jgi:cytochrome c2
VGDAVVQHLTPGQEPLAARSYAAHFLALGAALLAVTAWTVWDETISKRPWKSYQRRFQAEAGKLYRAELEAASKELEAARQTPEYGEARAALEAAQKAYDAPAARDERRQIQEQLASAQAEWDKVSHRFQILRGSYQATVYRYEHTRNARLKEQVARMDPEIAALAGRMGEIQKRKKTLLEKQRAAGEALEAARARLAHFEERVRVLERAHAALKDESVEIRQVVNARLNLVDRCGSCHLGADRPGLGQLPQPYTTHPAVYVRNSDTGKTRDLLKDHPRETFGCSTCHLGQGMATASVQEAHGEQEFWQTPLRRGRRVWASCQKCHDAQPDVAGVESGWEGRRLAEHYGCYACHKLPGFEQEAAVRIGPNLNVLGKKTYREWTPMWLKDPHGFRPATRMPNMLLSDGERRAISAYLLQAGNNSAPEPPRPDPPAAEVAAGKALFESVGCLGCHSVNGRGSRFAPDLSRVGEKVRPAYLEEWLRDPGKIQPGATMPSLRLSDTEIRRLAAFLSTLKQAFLPPLDFDPQDRQLAERGKSLIVRYNCFGCHRIPGLEGRPSLVPDLTVVGSKLIEEFDFGLQRRQVLTAAGLENEHENVEQARVAWILRKLKEPRSYDEGRLKKPEETLRMPRFGLRDAEAQAIATYLTGLTVETIPQEMREPRSERSAAMAAGAQIIRKYNCTGCHQLGLERVALKDGALLEGVTKTREDETLFFQLWREHPGLGRQAGEIVPVEASQIVVHGAATGGEIVPLLVENALAAQGLSLAQAQQDPAVLVKAEEARAFAPPVLFGEGRRVRPDWLFGFLNQPVTLRPWLAVRMPTFPLTQDEALTLARYFAAVDRQVFPFERDSSLGVRPPDYFLRAARLFNDPDVKCASCHVRGALKPQGDPSGWAPDLALAGVRLRPAWIADWLRDPQKLLPGTKMPTFFPEGDTRYQRTFPGKAEEQIQALKDYVLSLGTPRPGAARTSAGGQP